MTYTRGKSRLITATTLCFSVAILLSHLFAFIFVPLWYGREVRVHGSVHRGFEDVANRFRYPNGDVREMGEILGRISTMDMSAKVRP